MISCEFCETFKNTIFKDHLGTPASVFIEHICTITNLDGGPYHIETNPLIGTTVMNSLTIYKISYLNTNLNRNT